MRLFISGHLDLSAEEFEIHYKPKIDEAIKEKKWFIIGDAPGADEKAQEYIHEQGYTKVVIFHMLEYPRKLMGNFYVFGGFNSDSERDIAMTLSSDGDITWVRPGREKSGTAKNIDRRLRLKTGRYCFDRLFKFTF